MKDMPFFMDFKVQRTIFTRFCWLHMETLISKVIESGAKITNTGESVVFSWAELSNLNKNIGPLFEKDRGWKIIIKVKIGFVSCNDDIGRRELWPLKEIFGKRVEGLSGCFLGRSICCDFIMC